MRKTVSSVCSGAVLGLLMLLVDLGLLCGTVGNLAHPSYLAALLAAAAAGFALLRLQKRPSRFERWGVRRTGLALTALCFGLNLACVLRWRVDIYGDSVAFWDTARALAAGREPENAVYLALFPHLLGYSSFLSLFLRVFGEHPLVAPLLNVGLTTVSGLLLYRLGLRWLTPRQAGWVCLLWAVFPSRLLYNTLVLSEALYTCLLLGVFTLLAGLEDTDVKRTRLVGFSLAAGLLLWGANISRPLGAIVLIALPLWSLLLRGTGRQTARWLAALALLLCVYVPLGKIWDAHVEALVGEKPAPIPGYNIYVGFNQRTGGTYAEEDMGLLGDYRWEEGGSAADAQWKMLEAAKARVFSGELDFPRLFADKLRHFIGSDEGAAYTVFFLGNARYRLWAALCNTGFYLAALLANVGAWRLLKRRETGGVLLLCLFGLGLILAQMLVEVSSRYHYSLVPVLLMLAGNGINNVK